MPPKLPPFRAINVARFDLLLALFVFFFAVAAIFMSDRRATTTTTAAPYAEVVVTLTWPDSIDADLDLWVKGPNDRPVGYSNSHGHVFDLLHDCLGHEDNPTGHNFEIAISRGVPDGHYAVNVQFYASNDRKMPVPAHVTATIRRPNGETRLWAKDVTLVMQGQELTVAQFDLAHGALVPGSINDLPIKLRSEK